jgi:release factor glutamine methyltransferase
VLQKRFDLIVSNPPYVRESEKRQMSAHVLHYEPHQALFVSDTDPLRFYRRILQLGKQILKPNGKLYFEINEAFGKEMINLMQIYDYRQITLKQDIHHKDRFIAGTRK